MRITRAAISSSSGERVAPRRPARGCRTHPRHRCGGRRGGRRRAREPPRRGVRHAGPHAGAYRLSLRRESSRIRRRHVVRARLRQAIRGHARPDVELLAEILQWPDDTRIYCAHEYTQSNARFALTVEPQNRALKERAAAVAQLRAAGRATVPSTLGEERATNRFCGPKPRLARDDRRSCRVPRTSTCSRRTRALKDAF